MEVKELDIESFNKRYVDAEYPALLITNPTQPLVPILKSCLYDGNMPLIVEFNGTRKLMRRMSESAYNIFNLLNVCSGIYYLDKNGESHAITCIQDYLEVYEEWI